MTYNIHPLLVHFPIALLFLCSVIKILPLKKWLPNVAWKDIERTLLFFGVLGALAADLTGSAAEHFAHPNRQLIDAHKTFAALSSFIYGLLLGGEIVAVFRSMYGSRIRSKFISVTLETIEKILCGPVVSTILAFLGLIAISVTGLLGGAMVYGVTADPVAPLVLKMLGISLPQ